MSEVLKGNFKPKAEVKVEKKAAETVEEQFEREAKKHLGGSIAFVSRKKVLWSEEQ